MEEIKIHKNYKIANNDFIFTKSGFFDSVELYYFIHELSWDDTIEMIIELYREPYYHGEKITSLPQFSSLILQASKSRTGALIEDYDRAYPRPMWKYLSPIYSDIISESTSEEIIIHSVDPENLKIWLLRNYQWIYVRIEISYAILYYTGNDRPVVLEDARDDLIKQRDAYFTIFDKAIRYIDLLAS